LSFQALRNEFSIQEESAAVRTISILNFKGGTGKSSVAQNLGHALARNGYQVLVVDGDRQSNTTITLLKQRPVGNGLADVMTGKCNLADAIYETGRPGLYVVPSDGDLDHVAVHLKEHHRAYYTMQRGLEALQGQLDFVLFDQAGAFNPVMDALLIASQEMLIPCECEPYAVQGLFDMFAKLSRELEIELTNAGIIPYNTDMSRKMTGAYMQELLNQFEKHVLDPVRTDTAVPYAQSRQQTIFEYAESLKLRSRAAEDFTRLAGDLAKGSPA
jgi:chromosome partitioning protein